MLVRSDVAGGDMNFFKMCIDFAVPVRYLLTPLHEYIQFKLLLEGQRAAAPMAAFVDFNSMFVDDVRILSQYSSEERPDLNIRDGWEYFSVSYTVKWPERVGNGIRS